MEVGLDDADLALLRDFLSVAGDQGVRPLWRSPEITNGMGQAGLGGRPS